MLRDIFICHAFRDKESIVRPLRDALRRAGISVWYDEDEIHWGDPLEQLIKQGLAISRLVLVVLTRNFAEPGGWRETELNSAMEDQISSGRTRILPLVLELSDSEIKRRWPLIAGRRYERFEPDNLDNAVRILQQTLAQRSEPLLLTRAELNKVLGAVEQRIAQAQQEIWISGNDNMLVAKSLSGFVLRALGRGVRVRLLSVDPESPAAEMLPLIDPRFPSSAFFRSEVKSVEEAARGWRATRHKIEFRFLPILPAAGYFITDPGLPSQIVKLELYVAQPWGPLDSRPHLVITEAMSDWRDYFVRQFENYWNISRDPWENNPYQQ